MFFNTILVTINDNKCILISLPLYIKVQIIIIIKDKIENKSIRAIIRKNVFIFFLSLNISDIFSSLLFIYIKVFKAIL